LLGGYGVAGVGAKASQRYTANDNLDKVVVEFDLYALDTWDNERFFVEAYGVKK